MFKRKPIPRTVSLGRTDVEVYASNIVITSKYNIFTVIPKTLFEQFSKAANVYFLIISVVMYVGESSDLYLGTIKAYSTFFTLVVMVIFSVILALYDDYRRHVADNEVNGAPASMVNSGGMLTTVQWKQVQVGDILLVRSNEQLPADVVLLASSGDEGFCYVSTMNLDGETTLKTKAAVPSTQAALCQGRKGGCPDDAVGRVLGLRGAVHAEAPQPSIHNFTGSIVLNGMNEEPLGAKEFLLRGTVLRNTAWVIGVVIYTGKDTRVVINSRKAPLKIPNIERTVNASMLVILAAQAGMALVSDILYNVNIHIFASYWYLFPNGFVSDLIFPDLLAYFVTFFVLYSNLMPISLYATIELCNAAQTLFIKHDPEMYDSQFDISANVRASNLCQEIGQIDYVFSDKTGTLTQNVMELKRVFVAGEVYGQLVEGVRGFTGGEAMLSVKDENRFAIIRQFLEVLSVAHTVVVSKVGEGASESFVYEAESPDEGALVAETARLGWAYRGKLGQTMTVEVTLDGASTTQVYKVVALNAFTSTRKRMSMLVQNDVGDHLLFVKGADNVMIERALHVDPALKANLTVFAQEGLRTLVVGYRRVSREEALTWQSEYSRAQRVLEDREGVLGAVAEKIEIGLELLGATAIEDKLQDGVADTIVRIRSAKIKLWVLTGDKLETARNIGYSSRVLCDDMKILLLEASEEDSVATLQTKFGELEAALEWKLSVGGEVGLMVTGQALELILADSMESQFLTIARRCSVVIACRVSPLQKAQMVKLVRTGVRPQPVTLAVGDGANDVPMIQEAQVGVGICGREGRQAVNAADFSLGQFRFLERLLLVHGRSNYHRACKFTLYTFWRNAVQVLLIFSYSFFAGQSGITLFEDTTRMTFNFILAIPIVAIGMFDCDVSDKIILGFPQLYETGRLCSELSPRRMFETLVSAIVHSGLILLITYSALGGMSILGNGDYYTFGTLVYTVVIVVANYRVCFLTITWNYFSVLSLVASLLMYMLFLTIHGTWRKPDPMMYQVPKQMASSAPFWVCLLALPALSLVVDAFTAFLHLQFRPSRRDIILEIAPLNIKKKSAEEPKGRKLPKMLVAFAQERLPSRELRLTKHMTILAVTAAGAWLIAIGAYSLSMSRSVTQIRIKYDGSQSSAPCGTKANEVFDRPCKVGPHGQTTSCEFSIVVVEEMLPPILVYYSVNPFYQNYNTYVFSTSFNEVQGLKVSDHDLQQCTNTRSLLTPQGEVMVPCGLRATTMFNDTFEVLGKTLDETGIAWQSDVDGFQNPPDYGTRAGDISWLYERYPTIVSQEAGVKSEHFAAWYRVAALPFVGKRYAFLHEPLHKGETIQIRINASFPTDSFDATKEFVLTTTTALGGRDDSLGLLLLVSGVVCLFFGVFAVAAQKYFTKPVRRDIRLSGQLGQIDPGLIK